MTAIQLYDSGRSPTTPAYLARLQAERLTADPAFSTSARSGHGPHGEAGRLEYAREVPASERGDTHSDDARAYRGRRVPRGASPLFMAQHIAQEAMPDERPNLSPADGAARYPSLGYREELILPGQTVSMAFSGPLLDIYA